MIQPERKFNNDCFTTGDTYYMSGDILIRD